MMLPIKTKSSPAKQPTTPEKPPSPLEQAIRYTERKSGSRLGKVSRALFPVEEEIKEQATLHLNDFLLLWALTRGKQGANFGEDMLVLAAHNPFFYRLLQHIFRHSPKGPFEQLLFQGIALYLPLKVDPSNAVDCAMANLAGQEWQKITQLSSVGDTLTCATLARSGSTTAFRLISERHIGPGIFLPFSDLALQYAVFEPLVRLKMFESLFWSLTQEGPDEAFALIQEYHVKGKFSNDHHPIVKAFYQFLISFEREKLSASPLAAHWFAITKEAFRAFLEKLQAWMQVAQVQSGFNFKPWSLPSNSR